MARVPNWGADPSAPIRKINEGEDEVSRPQSIGIADLAKVAEQRLVGAEEKMIAIVDPAKMTVLEGPATATGNLGSLVHDDAHARPRQSYRTRQPGNSSADDVYGVHRCQAKWRKATHRDSPTPGRVGCRCRHPRRLKRSRRRR